MLFEHVALGGLRHVAMVRSSSGALNSRLCSSEMGVCVVWDHVGQPNLADIHRETKFGDAATAAKALYAIE